MIVVLIISVLIAIAIPAFAGARRRANDRVAQTNLRYALGAEKVFYTDALAYSDNSGGEIDAIEDAVEYETGLTPVTVGPVYLAVAGDIVYLSAQSTTGGCFYLFDDPFVGTGYAVDASCGAADTQTYTAGGW